jgi:hypothetical protein
MRTFQAIIAIISATLFSTLGFAAGPISPVKVGNWQGGSYTNDSTGLFSHCAISASYKSGIIFSVAISKDGSWRFGFINNVWRLTVGQTMPVDLTFDGRGPYHVYAKAIQANFVVAEMPSTSETVRLFRNAGQMNAFTSGQLFSFALTDTSVVIPALIQCVRNNGISTAAAQPLTTAPVVASPAVGPPPSRDAANTSAPTPDLHDEATELATNFVLNAKLDSPKILSRHDTPVEYAPYGADWRASGALGSVRIIVGGPDTKGIDVAAGVVAADARECKGKFASARSSEMVDSEVMFRGFSSCEDSGGSRTVEYFIVPRKKGGFALFSIVGTPTVDNPTTATPPDKLPIFQRAALIAAN